MQRVGSKGPAADAMRALVARLTPALLPPEVLHAAMEDAEGSQEGVWPAPRAWLAWPAVAGLLRPRCLCGCELCPLTGRC